jgi:hypothetical protein
MITPKLVNSGLCEGYGEYTIVLLESESNAPVWSIRSNGVHAKWFGPPWKSASNNLIDEVARKAKNIPVNHPNYLLITSLINFMRIFER